MSNGDQVKIYREVPGEDDELISVYTFRGLKHGETLFLTLSEGSQIVRSNAVGIFNNARFRLQEADDE